MLERSAGSEDGPSASLEPGTLLDSRYRVASVASRSSNGIVFNALDERSRQRVRLRVTAQPVVPALAGLRHPALPTVLRQGMVRGGEGRWSYAVLEWFDGAPMTLPEAPVADPESVRAWATLVIDLLDTVEHLHRAGGRAHGDLGLHSLWQGRDGRLRVIDSSAPDGVVATESVAWASPERLRGNPRDVRSDVYSVAAIAYALAIGAAPFGAEPLQARTGHLLWRLPEHPALPPWFLAVLRTAMEKHPHYRFTSAARMKAAMEQALRTFEGGEEPPYEQQVAEHVAIGDLDRPISEDLLALDGTMEPAPLRYGARPRRRLASPVLPLLLSSAGFALSVFAWAALLGLLAAVVSGRLGWG